jgi:hypothetical protein
MCNKCQSQDAESFIQPIAVLGEKQEKLNMQNQYIRMERVVIWDKLKPVIERRIKKPISSVNYLQNVYAGRLASKKIKAILDELIGPAAGSMEKR